MQKSTPVFAGIDIGTSGVRVVIGFAGDEGGYSIAGVGEAVCQGVRKGVITHPEEVAACIREATEDAERQAGVNIHRATVLVNGAQVGSQTSKGIVAISGVGRPITEEDRARVEEAATVIQMPTNREIIQVFAKNYRIDGDTPIKDPVGMQGVRLEVDAHIITVATPSLRSLDLALEHSGVRASTHMVAGLAAAEAVLDRRQKESGTAIVDFGASTINIAILEEGEIEHVAVIPVGGQNITNDLAIGLKTDLDIAEKVKKEFSGLGGVPRHELTLNNGGEKLVFDGSMAQMVIEARLEEIMEQIDKEFTKAKRSKKLPGGVVFVGGGAKLKGLDAFAKEKLGLPVTIGKINKVTGLTDKISDISLSTAVGLMMLDSVFVSHSDHHSGSDSGWFTNFNPMGKLRSLRKK